MIQGQEELGPFVAETSLPRQSQGLRDKGQGLRPDILRSHAKSMRLLDEFGILVAGLRQGRTHIRASSLERNPRVVPNAPFSDSTKETQWLQQATG